MLNIVPLRAFIMACSALVWLMASPGNAAGVEDQAGHSGRVLKPIVAEIVADPTMFQGQQVQVYGAVTRTADKGATLFIQDVSQIEMRVENHTATDIDEHRAVTVKGSVVVRGDEVVMVAEELILPEVSVLGGPCGCSTWHQRAAKDGDREKK